MAKWLAIFRCELKYPVHVPIRIDANILAAEPAVLAKSE